MADAENEQKPSVTTASAVEIFMYYAGSEGARAVRHFEEARRLINVRRQESFGEVREWLSILDALRAGLHSAANVSRVFWPSFTKDKSIMRRRYESSNRLRAMCGIPADHTLRLRKLRNIVEHMDEHLETWSGDARRPFMTIEVVEYARDMPLLVPLDDMCFLIYDLEKDEVRVPGATYSIADIKNAVIDVQDRISKGWDEIFKTWT